MRIVIILITFTFLLLCSPPSQGEDLSSPPIVSTRWGDLIGSWVDGVPGQSSSGRLAQFLGIPYAQPPVGELRLEKTAAWNTSWADSGPRLAIDHGPQCIQSVALYTPMYNYTQSEDCLTLNVWVPHIENVEDQLPVMVFIHGGGFLLGSATWPVYSGRILASHQQVIVVNMNYRLGGLGFVYSGNLDIDDLPGNQGLWDQLEALRWVKQNIAAFGGDPTRVTLFGQSAGSWSISAHLTSPHSRGLFQNAIMMSGALLSDAQICPRLARTGTQAMARRAGCPQEGREMKDCIKKLPLNDFLLAFNESHLHAVYGDDFSPISVREALSTGRYVQTEVNLLAGTVEDEGSFIVSTDLPTLFNDSQPNPENLPIDQAEWVLKWYFKDHPLVSETERLYLNLNDNSSMNTRSRVIRAVSDGFLACPTVEFARMKTLLTNQNTSRRVGSVYGYHFNQVLDHGKSLNCPDSMKWRLGPCHGDDLSLVLGLPYTGNTFGNFTDHDRAYSDTVMKIWGTFARTGAPPSQADTKWEPISVDPRLGLATVRIMEMNGLEETNHLLDNPDNVWKCEMWSRMAQTCWNTVDEIIAFYMLKPQHH